MKVCLISSSERSGGASIAANRLHNGFIQQGIESRMIVGNQITDDPTVYSSSGKIAKGWTLSAPTLDALPLRFYRMPENHLFSLSWLPDRVYNKITKIDPSIINLHWVCDGFLKIESLRKITKPIVWTLHDMWPFTGGCHYSQNCNRYNEHCGACPQLGSSSSYDISHCVWKRKASSWGELDLTIVTPSRWLASCAKASSLFKDCAIKIIPNGLNTLLYKPINKLHAREILALPHDVKLISFGAVNPTSDTRKGFHLLLSALQYVSRNSQNKKIELAVIGTSKPNEQLSTGLKINYIGKVHDDVTMALLYAASDVFVAPSLQDNLPNTVMESLACGTPCVAFDIGGMPDLIDHEKNGYLAKPFNTEDLARGICWIIEEPQRWMYLSQNARSKVEQFFALDKVARQYIQTFEEVCHE